MPDKRLLTAVLCAVPLLWINHLLSPPLWLASILVTAFWLIFTTAILTNLDWIPTKLTPWLLGLCAVAFSSIYFLHVDEWVSVIGDNIAYIRDAKMLIEGKPLVDEQYGIGVKALLVPPLYFFPDNVIAMKIVIASVGLLYPICTFLFFRHLAGPKNAALVAGLSGTVWFVVQHADIITADLPFPAFLFLALVLTVDYLRRPRDDWKWLAISTAGIGVAYFIKSPAMFVALAASIYTTLRGDWRRALLILGGVALVVIPNVIYLSIVDPDRIGYFSAMSHQIEHGLNIAEESKGGFWHNFFFYAFQKNPSGYLINLSILFYPLHFVHNQIPYGEHFQIAGWIVLILVLTGFIVDRILKHRSPLLLLQSLNTYDWFVLGYTATLFILPGNPVRYVIPILPFLVHYLFKGVECILGLVWGPKVQKIFAMALFTVLFLAIFSADGRGLRNMKMSPGYSKIWHRYYEGAVWIRDHTPPRSRVATRKPGLVWFWSGRESDRYPDTTDVEEALQRLRAFDYVLLDNLPWFTAKEKFFLPVLKAYPKKFQVVHLTAEPKNYVIQVLREGFAQIGIPVVEPYQVEVDISNPLEMNTLALTYIHELKFEKGRKILKELVKNWPDRVEFRINLAVALVNLGKFEEVLSHCKQILEMDPKFAKAYFLRAETYKVMDKAPEAIANYRRALELEPDNAIFRQEFENYKEVIKTKESK